MRFDNCYRTRLSKAKNNRENEQNIDAKNLCGLFYLLNKFHFQLKIQADYVEKIWALLSLLNAKLNDTLQSISQYNCLYVSLKSIK